MNIFFRLWKRPEKEVAVVSHGIVLQHMLYVFASDCDESIRHELCKRYTKVSLLKKEEEISFCFAIYVPIISY